MSAVKAIYAGARAVGIVEEDDRRDFFERVTGKRKLRDMTPADKETVVTELRRLGFKPSARGKLTGPFAQKLQALWISAWNLGLVRSRKDEALLAFVKRQTGISHTRFLQDAKEAARAIEALKGWIERETGLRLDDPDRPDWMQDYNAQVAWAQWSILAPTATTSLRGEFDNEVAKISGKTTINLLSRADWRAVANAFGTRIRKEKTDGHP
jgi:hypothetical protein